MLSEACSQAQNLSMLLMWRHWRGRKTQQVNWPRHGNAEAHGNHRRGGIYSAYESPEQYRFMTTSTDSEGDVGNQNHKIPKLMTHREVLSYIFFIF